ncbi:MAG: HAMP domain-containing protein [Candidatus Heimdallarchaeaceae archaeon]
MLRSSVKQKIIFRLLVVEAIILAIIGSAIYLSYHALIHQHVKERLAIPSDLINTGKLNVTSIEDQALMESLVGKGLSEVFVFSSNYTILCSMVEKHIGTNISLLSWFNKAWLNGISNIRYIVSNHIITSIANISAFKTGTDSYFLLIRYKLYELEHTLTKLVLFYASFAIFVLAFSGFFLFGFSFRSILERINNLTKEIQKVEAGDYTAYIDPRFSDEIGVLETAFNQMAQELEKQKAQIREAFKQINKNIIGFSLVTDQIRNPLSVILGLIELQEDIKNRETILKEIEKIQVILARLDKEWQLSEELKRYLRKG